MFTQVIRFRTKKLNDYLALAKEWEQKEAGRAPGYIGMQLMRDRDHPDQYSQVVLFENYEKAMQNSNRPETNRFAERIRAILEGEPEYHNLDNVYESPGFLRMTGAQPGAAAGESISGTM